MPAGDPSADGHRGPAGAGDVTMVTSASPPRTFGRYELLERLGSGGMADVLLALAKGPFDAKKLVVLKRPRAASSEYAEMFMDEARLAMRLNHSNVVQTYEVGVDNGAFFLAMEFLEGQPLHRVIGAMISHNQHLSHAHLARIAADALSGLHYAHELSDYDGTALQIVHRDVSPHNVFVTYEGQIKVVDFGIAKATMNEVHTQTGAVKGKLAYMAPEQATAGAVDRRADVFAVGVILWEMIARRRLLTGTSSAELLHNLLTMEFPPLSCETPDVHPVLEAIVMRALHRDVADRYATALEMREALESYIVMAGQPVRASDIGHVVNALFAGARDQMSTRLRAHIQSSGARSGSGNVAVSSPSIGTRPTGSTSFVGAGGDTNGLAVVTPPLGHARGEWRTIASLLAVAASMIVLAGALIVTIRMRAPKETTPVVVGVSAIVETVSAPAPIASASVVPASPALPSTVVVAPTPRPVLVVKGPRDRAGSSGGAAAPKRPIDTSFPK